MRVQVGKLRSIEDRDGGATALILVFMTLTFLGFAAFAVDAGAGYLSKRNLQNAADAAALAAADSLVDETGTCAQVAADTTAVDAAHDIAADYSDDNRASNIETGFEVRCDDSNRRIEVWYRNGGTVDSIFSAMIGAGSRTAAEREAVASVGVPGSVTGLRPYFMCITDARAFVNTSNVQRFEFPNNLCQSQPGNWYPSDCPEDGESNNQNVIEENTVNGCQSEISIVDLTAANGDPVLEKQLLIAACEDGLSAENGCLTGNTGGDFQPLSQEWAGLLGQTIALPVFDLDTVQGNGDNARYPIRAILGAKVCGYSFGSGVGQRGVSSDADCAGVTLPPRGDNNEYIWLKYETYQTSGTSKPSTCAVGDPNCDFGLRNVSLDK